jgi:DeoR/GlpR family transcriptional regulator of sugar metabolism
VRAEERRSRIIELLEREGLVQVEALAQRFGVSLVTIRKDLAELEEQGLLQRTHGGAVHTRKSLFNPSFREKLYLRHQAKQAIAQAALEYLEEGDTLILNAGTTTLFLAQLLKRRFRSLYILTNSIPIALELAETKFDIFLLGGQMRHHSMALIGPATVQILGNYHADKALLGATGVSLVRGYTTPNPLEAETKRAMLQAADRAIALVDSSKLGQSTLASFARLEEVSLLITDDEAPSGVLGDLQARGLNVRVVSGKLSDPES